MSVTQNYTIHTSSTVLMYIKLAVMTQVRADALAKRTPGEEYDAYLKEQIATGTEALTALNAFTSEDMHGPLDARTMATVLRELRNTHNLIFVGPVTGVGESEWRARIESIQAALLVLEGPK